MRKYYVNYMRHYRNYRNAYSLRYTETPEQDALAISQGYERITRRQAISLCRAERDRRKYDPSFSCYASDVISPVTPYDYDDEWMYDPHMIKIGYFIERV